jgi:hypothetical protein
MFAARVVAAQFADVAPQPDSGICGNYVQVWDGTCRQRDRPLEMLASWSEIPRAAGRAFYDRLQAELAARGFDGFAEGLRAADCSERRGRPSLPLGRSSPVKNAEDAAIRGVSGRRKYPSLQGSCP